MKKTRVVITTVVIISLFSVLTIDVHRANANPGGVAAVIGIALAKGAAEKVGKGIGRIAGAAADRAQEEIHGGKYASYIEGKVKIKGKNKITKITTQREAFVEVGSISVSSSRLSKLKVKTKNNIGPINAGRGAIVDIGTVRISRAHITGTTDIDLDNNIRGGVDAGSDSFVRVGTFSVD